MDDAAAEVEVAETPKAKGSGEFVRVYVVVMSLMAAFLGWLWWHNDSQADEFRQANDAAKAIFGDGPAGAPLPDRPTTIRGLAVGVLKYLATSRESGKAKGGVDIPVQTIIDTESGLGMKHTNIDRENISKVAAKRYEEISVSVTFDQTDLERLAKFLFNIEARSPNLRILDFSWDLKMPEKDNPIVPGAQYGNLVGKPRVKIGFRRPLTGSR